MQPTLAMVARHPVVFMGKSMNDFLCVKALTVLNIFKETQSNFDKSLKLVPRSKLNKETCLDAAQHTILTLLKGED